MSSNRTRTVAIVAALLLVTAVAFPAVAAAETSLSVAVDQDHETGEAVVTVTDDGTALENATVTVADDENASYEALNETYEADENGEVVLPNPNETVDVTLTAEYENESVNTTETLTPLSESLDVAVEQTDSEDATVTVTQYGDAVENASVDVSTDENVTYAALNETYETDENGTTVLPAPSEDLNVTVTATSGELSAETSAELTAPELAVAATQNDAGELYVEVTEGDEYVENATVDVESDDGEYAYDGTHTATDGTLTLPAPTENVTVTVTATADGETATTNTTLTVQADDNPNNDFAEALVAFLDHTKSQDYEGPLGQQVSEFVHANNPAADKANGPPEHAGPNASDDGEDGEDNETERRGPPENAGPPEDAGPSFEDDDADTDDVNETDDGADADAVDGDEEDESDEEAAEDDDDEGESGDADDERGPPEHAGGN
ncbi:MAG: hypothetical protein ACOCSN_02580 [Halanaeroarchaeum sp.]